MAKIECSFGRDDVVSENRYREPILRDGLFSDNDLLATYDCLRAAPDNPGGLFWFPIEKLRNVRAVSAIRLRSYRNFWESSSPDFFIIIHRNFSSK